MSCYTKVTLQSAATSTGNGTAVECTPVSDGPYYSLTAQVRGITTATITWEGTIDGSNWVAIQATNLTSGTAATTTESDGLFRLTVHGLQMVRARISAYTSGTITITGVLVEM